MLRVVRFQLQKEKYPSENSEWEHSDGRLSSGEKVDYTTIASAVRYCGTRDPGFLCDGGAPIVIFSNES